MSLQFATIGFINFNKEYNKVLKSGAITVSFTSSAKDKDGNYQTQYFNGLVPAKLVVRIKPLLNKEVCDIKGVVNPAEKGYVNFTILEVGKHVKKDNNVKQTEDIDLPF